MWHQSSSVAVMWPKRVELTSTGDSSVVSASEEKKNGKQTFEQKKKKRIKVFLFSQLHLNPSQDVTHSLPVTWNQYQKYAKNVSFIPEPTFRFDSTFIRFLCRSRTRRRSEAPRVTLVFLLVHNGSEFPSSSSRCRTNTNKQLRNAFKQRERERLRNTALPADVTWRRVLCVAVRRVTSLKTRSVKGLVVVARHESVFTTSRQSSGKTVLILCRNWNYFSIICN